MRNHQWIVLAEINPAGQVWVSVICGTKTIASMEGPNKGHNARRIVAAVNNFRSPQNKS
jgi:hypothetical protein